MSTERNIGTFEIPMANGVMWHGVVHLTRHPGGRRVKLVAEDGHLMFDSQDCDGLADGMARLGQWMEHFHQAVESRSCPCAHCQAKRVEAAAREQYCEHCPNVGECIICGRGKPAAVNVLIAH